MLRIDWKELSSEAEASAEEARQIAGQRPIHNQRRLPMARRPKQPKSIAERGPVHYQIRPDLKSVGVMTVPPPPLIAPSSKREPSESMLAKWPFWDVGERGDWVRVWDVADPPPGIHMEKIPPGQRGDWS